jgi:GAF domain-containing protein
LAVGSVVALAGSVVAAFLARNAADALVALPLLLVIVTATVIGGWIPGVIAVLATTVLLEFEVLLPRERVSLTVADVAALVAYAATGLLIVWLVRRQQLDRAAIATVNRRLSFLAEASSVMEATLDPREAIDRLSRYVVPALGDWCAVHLVTDEGEYRAASVAHQEPSRASAALEVQRRWPIDPSSDQGVPKVARTGEAVLFERIDHPMLAAAARDPAHLAALEDLGLTSLMILPLTARGSTFGTLSLALADEGESYSSGDLSFGMEVARATALAIDTLRSYDEAKRAASQNELLRRLASSLASSASRLDVIESVIRDAIQLLDADAALIAAVAEDQRNLEVIGQTGYGERSIEEWQSFPIDAQLPMSVAVRERRPVVVRDWQERDRDYPLLAGMPPHEHQIVCIPLQVRDGVAGGMSISFPPQRDISPLDLDLLTAIGNQAGPAMQRASLYDERALTARMLQQNLIPSSLPHVPTLELAVRYWPAGDGNTVGGDFYDVLEIGPRRWLAIVGDVCGMGPEAAAITGLVRHTMWAIAPRSPSLDPAELLQELNAIIVPHVKDQMFFTAAAVVIDTSGSDPILHVACAGHPLPVLVNADGLTPVGVPGSLLGILDRIEVCTTRIELPSNASLLLYTDGVTERGRGGHHLAEDAELSASVGAIGAGGGGAERIADAIEQTLAPDQPLEDDAAVLVIGRR